MYDLSRMPTNDYESRMANLEKGIRKTEMSEGNRETLWKFKRDLQSIELVQA